MPALACIWFFLPAALLCSLFCARLGVERGCALAGGILPGLAFFGASLFAAYHFTGATPGNAAGGWLLLTAFAVLRADPPVPPRAGLVWLLAAGLLGALGIHERTNTVISFLGLCLYVGWSAGYQPLRFMGSTAFFAVAIRRTCVLGWSYPDAWKFSSIGWVFLLPLGLLGLVLRKWRPPRVVPAAGAENPLRAPMSSARRIVDVLLFLALVGVPGAVIGTARHEPIIGQWENVFLPLDVAVGLILTSALDFWLRPGTTAESASAS